jgi:glycosyltransferase involved in cell wall biosynthesis
MSAAACMKISIVIPCFNEEEVLPQLFQRVTASADEWKCDWEVLCVDDGSKDRTWQLLVDQHQRDGRWNAISFARNFGHQTAVSAGIHHATGDAVIVMDADLQDPPEQLVKFIEAWKQGFEVVYAIRQHRKEGPLKRSAYWFFYRLLSRIVSFPIPEDSGDFCLLDRRVVEVLKAMPERNRFVRGLRAWAGFRQTGIPYERSARSAGTPKYSARKLFRLAFDGICSFSTAPLRIVFYLGLWVSLLSLLGILFTLSQKLFPDFYARHGFPPVQGFTTIVISVLFLGGIQLISLGVIGEYIGRIYDEVKRRPLWVVQASLGVEPKTPGI